MGFEPTTLAYRNDTNQLSYLARARSSKFNTQVSKVKGKNKVNKIKTGSEESWAHIRKGSKWAR